MATVNSSFECPSGFKEEEEVMGQLYLEDLDEDSELWLIRMPSDLELSVVDRTKIFLCDKSTPISVQSESGKQLECFAENCEIPNLRVVLPQKSDKKLHEVRKVFKGSIIISEGFNLCDETEVDCEMENEPVNTISKSFGSPRLKERKKKSSKSLDNLTYEVENAGNVDILPAKESRVTTPHSHSKRRTEKEAGESIEIKNEPQSPDRKERKKKSSATPDLNYDTEDAESMIASYTKQHSHSKKRSSKRATKSTEIKNESMSSDRDEFPLCNSQA